MAVEHGEVQQVVVDTGDTEAVLVLLPETQNRCAADPRQTDLRGRWICSTLKRLITQIFSLFVVIGASSNFVPVEWVFHIWYWTAATLVLLSGCPKSQMSPRPLVVRCCHCQTGPTCWPAARPPSLTRPRPPAGQTQGKLRTGLHVNTHSQNHTWEQQTELVLNIKLWDFFFITVHELDVKILHMI